MTARALPRPTPETQLFWDKAKAHELWLPLCVDTGRTFFPPRQFSPFTGGAVEWHKASGKARLASFLVVHRPAPGFEDENPYIVAIAELAEGPRLLTNLPGTSPDPALIRVGAELVVSFEERDGMTIPQFRVAAP